MDSGGQELPSGQVGELWLRGPNITTGYWRRPEETREIFGATLGQGDGPWLRTGDLAFFHQGVMAEIGTPDQLFGAPQNPETQKFLASVR